MAPDVHNRFSPTRVAELTGIAPELLRNWRARGFIDRYGHQDEAGRWLYDTSDLVAFWIAERLSGGERGMDRKGALMHGAGLAISVIFHIERENGGGPTHDLQRYSVLIWNGDDGSGFGWELAHVNSLAEFERGAEFDRIEVFDHLRLAKAAPEYLVEIVLANAKTRSTFKLSAAD